MHFNTSHVSINLWCSDGMACVTGISIHLMFLLITFWNLLPGGATLISIHLMFLLIPFAVRWKVLDCHFNTSHVSINPELEVWIQKAVEHFNTSHVSINHIYRSWSVDNPYISIHLMFLLILYHWASIRQLYCISIHLMFLLIVRLLPRPTTQLP